MRQQLQYYLALLLFVPLLPILFLQGRRARARVPRLPEADGRDGIAGNGPEPLTLLVLGESTVAGVGMSHHREGFAGWIARHASERAGRSVRWKVLGRSGLAAGQVRDELVPLIPDGSFDFIVIGLGGNDTFKLHSPLRWKRDMISLIEAIRRRQPNAPIIIANLPPIRSFPALPSLLRWTLGGLVGLHGDVIRDLPRRFPDVHYASRRIRLEEWIERSAEPIGLADLFCDGVHPSSLTYRIWSREFVDLAWDQGLLRGAANLPSGQGTPAAPASRGPSRESLRDRPTGS